MYNKINEKSEDMANKPINAHIISKKSEAEKSEETLNLKNTKKKKYS